MDSNASNNSIYRNGIDLGSLENYEKTESHSEESSDKNIADCEVNKEYLRDKIRNPDDSSNVNSTIECTTPKALDSENLKENNGLSELKVELDDAVSKLPIHQSTNQTTESITGNQMNPVLPIEKSSHCEPDRDYISSGHYSTGGFDLDSGNKSSINGSSNFSGNARNISGGTIEAHDENTSGNDSFSKRNDTKQQFMKLEMGPDIENQLALSNSLSSNTSKMIEIPELSDDKNSKSQFLKDHELNLRVQANNLTLKEENDLVLSEDDIEDDSDTVCGIGGFNPKWLQAWATPRVFLTLYSLLGVISGMYYTYRVGALTTLEKRFSFNSQMSGTVMMVDEVTPVFLGAIVGYFGGKGHRPRMFGIGMIMSTFCCFISAFPYFIYGPSSHLNIQNVQNKSGVQICEEEIRAENCNADDRPPTVTALFFLMLAGVLKGFGNLGYYAIGLSYMDDISKKKNTAIYFAVIFSLRLVGPVFGYLMSSFFLKFYENPFEDPGYGPEDPRWIGAWWIGFLLQGVLQLLLTIPLALFPRRLPGQKRLPTNSEAKDKLSSGFKGLIAALKRLLKNPLYLSIVINTIMNIFGSLGHFMMLPKYMEQQFRLTASDANLYSGPPGIIAIMLSTLLGGYLIWKYKPNVKSQIVTMIILESISAVGFLLLMVPHCDKVQMSHFGLENHGLVLEGLCNVNCNCTTKVFTPLCGSDGKTSYFSPCFAGCTENLNKSFSDCSCIMDPDGQGTNSYAKEGFCISLGCWSQALGYIISLPILQFIASILKVQYTVILVRSINPEDKSIALGLFEALICIFGFVPYLSAFGALVDSSCLIWEKSCGKTGNCWLYDIDKFNTILHVVSGVFSFMAAASLIPTYFLSGRLIDLYEDENDNNISCTTKQNEKGAVKNNPEPNSASTL